MPPRLQDTQRNLHGYPVEREGGVLTGPVTFRHTLHSSPFPPLIYHRIFQAGLRVSTDLATAQWGVGVYVWDLDAKVSGQPYIDVRVPAGTLIEQLRVKENDPFYRLLPMAGTHIIVVIVGTNIPQARLDEFREFAQG